MIENHYLMKWTTRKITKEIERIDKRVIKAKKIFVRIILKKIQISASNH